MNLAEVKARHYTDGLKWSEAIKETSQEEADGDEWYETHKARGWLIKQLDAAQAKIDALMLEYCPDEMTPEQLERWGECQVAVPESELKAALIMTTKTIQLKDNLVGFVIRVFKSIEIAQQSRYRAERDAVERWHLENPALGSKDNPFYVQLTEKRLTNS